MFHASSRPARPAGRRILRSLPAKIFVIVGLLAVCGWALRAQYLESGSILRLGLDLQGGMHLVLGVDDPEGVLSPEARADAVQRSQRIIQSRVDELGVAEPVIQVVGRDRLIVELAGVTDEARARELIGRTAMLEWRMVRPHAPAEAALPQLFLPSPFPGEFLVAEEEVEAARSALSTRGVLSALPRGTEFRWGWEPQFVGGRSFRSVFLVDDRPFLTGQMLEDARSGRDPELNHPLVHFDLSRAGGRIFADMTGRHVGERMAILLDGEVVSAPAIRSRIGARGVIELPGAALEEARDLALVLRAGALPAPLRILEERSVGPSLGQDSIDQGRIAGTVGLALVVLVMIAYYRMAGVLAVTALGAYVLLVLGGLAVLGRTLTLPGIAGIILSIGMAVDANVLIFERIREEEDAGRSPSAAVDRGFAQALSAIVDANMTTLITALVLFQLGSGPVRGFAVTLSVGILASFFSALYVTRTLFLIRGRALKEKALPVGRTR